MGTAERRAEIMRILFRRRYETITNLANEFGVSIRTILRDIDVLSTTEPIYTQCGRYGGGVYVTDSLRLNNLYMTERELAVLHKIVHFSESKSVCNLNEEEYKLLKKIISQHTKPKDREESI